MKPCVHCGHPTHIHNGPDMVPHCREHYRDCPQHPREARR